MPAAVLLAWLSGTLGVPCYSADIPPPAVGFAYSLPEHLEFDSSYVVPFVRRGVAGLPIGPRRARAMWVVAHELGHLRNGWTEQLADRWAAANWSFVVGLLGGTRQQAIRAWGLLHGG